MQHSQVLIPWVEANQGFLTLLALVLALVAFVVENRRANKAEMHNRATARDQEALDRERALDFEVKEAKRTRELQNLRVTEFVGSVAALIDMAEGSISEGIALSNQGPWFKLPASVAEVVAGISSSLTSLLPASPLDPKIILATQRAASVTGMTAKMGEGDTTYANQTLVAAREALREAKANLQLRQNALLER